MYPLLSAEKLSQKIERYTTAQWWIPAVAHQAVPMLCIPKKSGKLCTVFDLREQNNNTVKDVTPFPDQDIICIDMARAAYWSKLDMSKAYKQIHIIPEHVHKRVFATVLGTFRSQVMQMGDCNAPSMFQQLMTAIFWDCISQFCYEFILIFNIVTAKIMFYWKSLLVCGYQLYNRSASRWVMGIWALADSCIVSLGAKGSSGTISKDSISGSILWVISVNLVWYWIKYE